MKRRLNWLYFDFYSMDLEAALDVMRKCIKEVQLRLLINQPTYKVKVSCIESPGDQRVIDLLIIVLAD